MASFAALSPVAITLLWMTAFTVLGGVFVLARTDPFGTARSGPNGEPPVKLREFGDPMVASHAFAIFPFVFALYLGMPVTAVVIAASSLASLTYHLTFEANGGAIEMTDSYLACFVFYWMVCIFCVSMSLQPDWHVVCITVTFAMLAILVFKLAGDTESEWDRTVRMRLHPLWHILGYIAMMLVFLNFKRHDGVVKMSDTPWVRALQSFSF